MTVLKRAALTEVSQGADAPTLSTFNIQRLATYIDDSGPLSSVLPHRFPPLDYIRTRLLVVLHTGDQGLVVGVVVANGSASVPYRPGSELPNGPGVGGLRRGDIQARSYYSRRKYQSERSKIGTTGKCTIQGRPH